MPRWGRWWLTVDQRPRERSHRRRWGSVRRPPPVERSRLVPPRPERTRLLRLAPPVPRMRSMPRLQRRWPSRTGPGHWVARWLHLRRPVLRSLHPGGWSHHPRGPWSGSRLPRCRSKVKTRPARQPERVQPAQQPPRRLRTWSGHAIAVWLAESPRGHRGSPCAPSSPQPRPGSALRTRQPWSASSNARSWRRARLYRLCTVPSGISNAAAVWAMDQSSTRRRTTTWR